MPQLPLAMVVVGYLLAFVTILRIVMQRREPTATLAWAMGIILVPYVGVLAYVVFGRRRMQRHVKRRRARASAIEPHLARLHEGVERLAVAEAPPDLTRPAEHELVQLTNRIGQRLPTCGNRVKLFVNADSSYLALERAIEAARNHVHMEYYIFEPDQTGRRFRDLLVAKAREGVSVRLLVDGVGSFGVDTFMAPLVEAGGLFAEFSPVGVRHSGRANLRNHRKIAVVDEKIAFTGGVNIGDDYTGRKRRVGPWRDTHLRIDGPAAYHLQEIFAEDWHFATGEDPLPDDWEPRAEEVGDVMVQVVASGPDADTHPIHRIFFAAINSAKQRVYLTTPYFVPDQAMLVALQTSALRGVDVRLLLPFRSDMPLVLHAGRSYYDELLSSGVRVYEYLEGVLHAKTMVVDDTWATVGSANMDVRSFHLNFEVNAAIFGPTFANMLGKVFERDLKGAREVTHGDLASRGIGRRIAESFARTLSPVL